jgi:hypothetical protein
MFHQIIGYKNVVNYGMSTLQWWTSCWHQAKKISRVFTKFCIFPSLVISLNFKQIISRKYNIFKNN